MTKIEKLKKKFVANQEEKSSLEATLAQLKYDREVLETAIESDTQSGNGLEAFRSHKKKLRDLDDEINFVEIRLASMKTDALAKESFEAWDEYVSDYENAVLKRQNEIETLQRQLMSVVDSIADSQCEALKTRAMLADFAGVRSTGIPIADEFPAFRLPFFGDVKTLRYLKDIGLLAARDKYYTDVFTNKISDAKK